jgi:lipopolysaccharide export system protein LptC
MPHLIAICNAVNYRSPIPSRLSSRGIPVSDDAGLTLRREAAFGAAVRHSRLVVLLRKFIPIFLGGSVVLTGLWLWLEPFKAASELPVSIGSITIEGSKLKMEAPKLTGFSKDGQPYNVTAESALQDLKKPGVIELSHIVGHFSSGNRKTVLNAKSGVYDAKADKMHVFDGIDFQSNDGEGGRLSEATVETKKGHLTTDQPVDLYFKGGTLRGDAMEVFDHGKVIVFQGDVRMELHPDSQTAAVPPETATQ